MVNIYNYTEFHLLMKIKLICLGETKANAVKLTQ